jgi:predicted ester cyclase
MLAALAAGVLTLVGLRRRSRARETPVPDAAEIARRVLEEPWKGNWDVIETHVSPDYVGHDPAAPGPIHGPAGMRANIERYLAGFPDAAITVDDQFAVDGKVATRWTARGTQTGEIAGIAPTGKEVTVSGLTVTHLDGDVVVEDWTTWDALGMLVQLGAVATATPA